MIKKVELTNFYSFGKTTIELHPETNILIGINGSGKSNFLKALRLLKEGVVGMGLKKYVLDHLGGFDSIYHKSRYKQSSNEISIIFTFDASLVQHQPEFLYKEEDIIYRITLIKSPGLQNYYVDESLYRSGGEYSYLSIMHGLIQLTERTSGAGNLISSLEDELDPQELALKQVQVNNDNLFAINVIRKHIRDIFIYDYFDTMPGSAIRRPMLATSENYLTSNGSNLTQLLNTIKINYKDSYRKIVEMLREVNPNFEGFDFNFIGGNIELMLEERGFNSSIHVSNISDGTLRYLCLLAIICNPNRGKLICIDEPELGLHPDMILNLASAIKDAAADSTFVILTHSENLLNYFDIENLRVFEKDEQNGTIVKSFSTDQFAEWYEDYTIGQMWKQGDFGGVRYGN